MIEHCIYRTLKMKNLIIVLLVFFSLNTIAQEKYFNSESDIKVFSEKVTLLFKENKPVEAFKELSAYWPLPETELELIKEKTVKGLNLVQNTYGKPMGTKRVNYKVIENTAIRDAHFVKYEISALRFIYIYYKTDKGWILNQFKFDENFKEEF